LGGKDRQGPSIGPRQHPKISQARPHDSALRAGAARPVCRRAAGQNERQILPPPAVAAAMGNR